MVGARGAFLNCLIVNPPMLFALLTLLSLESRLLCQNIQFDFSESKYSYFIVIQSKKFHDNVILNLKIHTPPC